MNSFGLLLSDDLIFASRITGAARALCLEVLQARSPELLVKMAQHRPPTGVLIDLAHPALDLHVFLEALAATCPVMPRVTAYGSHVDVESLRAARAAGCDPVLPRSKFVEDLEHELPRWLGCTVEP